jgi:diguanylate cyclase (GGDEF)-like protein
MGKDMLASLVSYFKMHKKEFLIFSLLSFVWCCATWIVSERIAANRIHEYINRERIHAKEETENVASTIGQRIFQVRSVATILSTDYYVVSALIKFGPSADISSKQVFDKQKRWLSDPGLSVLNGRLDKLRTEILLHTLFVLNAEGDCIAAAKPQEFPVFIGVNYSDRKYFLDAQRGDGGRQFAVGRTDNIRALFFSRPVLDSGKFIGAIVSRLNVESLADLVFDHDVFVTDENGVVILAKDASLLMKAMPGSKCLELDAETASGVYKKHSFECLELGHWQVEGINDLVHWKGVEYPFLHTSIEVKDEKITVHVLRELKQVLTIKNDRIMWFSMFSLAGTLFLTLCFGIFAYIRSISSHRQELIALNKHLDLLARTDALTGCANRRSFFESLEAERQRSIRYKLAFSMLSLDIDNFKRVNDAFGHPVGDQVLCSTVSIIENIIRPSDKLGRVGGEEFGVLLVKTTETDAFAVAERIRASIENVCTDFEGLKVKFTVSIGVSQWKFKEASGLDALIKKCDKALYEAKKRGRNQVVVM